MRRRLLVARGLIHRPRLVLLDEPTVGLDPQVRQELWTLIDGLRSDGVTVLMSTHYIEEAERLADTVAVMSQGRIIAQGSPAELVRAHAGEQVVEVYGAPEQLERVSELAASNGWPFRRSGPAVAIMRAETLNGIAPEGVRRPANLEDAFVALTGQEIE
jgi:lipooligosaccharide transport system ATP-binding protein